MCTINTRGRLFGPDGCQVPVGSGTCGETRTLEIINEFKRLYEEKMQQIESTGGGDCLQEKVKLQQEWIGDLTSQNEMLIKAVEELEHEATERVHILEDKLQQSAQCICEVMKRYREYDVTNDLLAEPLQKVFCLENDQKNLLEFIRRVREDNRWDVNGLTFYEVSYQDLFGCNNKKKTTETEKRYKETDSNKAETKLRDKDCYISDLQGKLNYVNSFGDIESLSQELKCKREECLDLQKTMKDTQKALVEEIASKHDTILQLKRECQQLEDTCLQADKQTAFRDDIIKELRKEIKQLKQQLTQDEIVKLNATIDELQNNLQKTKCLQEEEEKKNEDTIDRLKETVNDLLGSLKQAEEKYEREVKICKICKGRSKVGFVETVEVQASLDELDSEQQMETIEKRYDIIKLQTDTLNILQLELDNLKEKESEMRRDKENKCCEVQILKNRVAELENALEDAEGKAANLQMAVDLYLNSVNVLEASEDKYKMEIEQQKLTISNLQRALVAAKQELDETRQKSQDNELEQHTLINYFTLILTDMAYEKEDLVKQCECMTEDHEYLQDMNFDLEVEHCTSLQDVDLLENRLFKYQSLLRSSEDECNQYRHYCIKLAKQKKCYEEIVAYFKQEMGSLSGQLYDLQELLTLSNESAQEETCKLMQAYLNVQAENEKLCTKLAAAEQKAVLECQMNQLHESKIYELEQLISERELDLSRHDQAIMNIRQSLQCSLHQNEELQTTIVELHDTIAQLQNGFQMYEAEHCKGKEGTQQCWAQILLCKQKLEELKAALDEKTRELCRLEMAYNDQTRELKVAQMELKEMKEKQKDKQRNLKCTAEELRQKLVKAEEDYCKVSCEISNLQTQLANVTRREAVKDLEVKRYRKIVADLKNTLIDLNKSLASGKDLQKIQHKCSRSECRKNIQPTGEVKNQDVCISCPCEVEFYQSIVETLKKSVIDLKKRLAETQQLNQQLEEDGKRKDVLLESLSKEKDKEFNDLRKQLTEKLRQSQAEETRYLESANQFQKELSAIRQELEVKTIQLNDLKKNAQEINSSKCIQLVYAQEEVNSLKEELNRILMQHCALNTENEKLHTQSACMQATVSKLEEKSQLLKGQLEQYLAQLQSVQDEKEILVHKNRELLSELRSLQCSYSSASKQQRELLQTQCPSGSRRPRKKVVIQGPNATCPPPTCPSPWSLGSQGTVSVHDIHSPSRSPCLNEESDWYSSTFKNDSDEEEDEEDWVSKVEHLAAQVRRTNNIWKNKINNPDHMVSRDTKK